MIPHNPSRPVRRKGFTLVEVLVCISIIAVLATVVALVLRSADKRARAVKRLSDIRQAGTVLMAKASETNGRCAYFAGGSSGGFDVRAYNIVREGTGVPVTNKDACEVMHWDIKALPTSVLHWNCYGVNFQSVPLFGAVWTQESLNYNGQSYNVKSLIVAAVTRPESYPLLIDSSTSDGKEIFRINEGNGDCVGLRNEGKANAFLLDGSARSMNRSDLKNAGFTKAYDNSVTPPRSVTL
jgi:prepilin-type N-terminal cleavage/methylation domain-containing protein